MPTSKKPRKRYKPKPVRLNAFEYAIESVAPVQSQKGYIPGIALRNHSAMAELTAGRATSAHVGLLVGMSNMVDALTRMGVGVEYIDVAKAGDAALAELIRRAHVRRRYTPTGPEITAINALMELHDAIMETINIKQMEDAIALARKIQKTNGAQALPAIGEL